MNDKMSLELTRAEAKTLLFYMEKAKIDVEGMHAIGIAAKESVDNIKSIIKKLKEAS